MLGTMFLALSFTDYRKVQWQRWYTVMKIDFQMSNADKQSADNLASKGFSEAISQ